MFNKPTSGASLLNKSSCLVPAICVTKFIIVSYDLGHTLLCCLSRTQMFNKSTSGAAFTTLHYHLNLLIGSERQCCITLGWKCTSGTLLAYWTLPQVTQKMKYCELVQEVNVIKLFWCTFTYSFCKLNYFTLRNSSHIFLKDQAYKCFVR